MKSGRRWRWEPLIAASAVNNSNLFPLLKRINIQVQNLPAGEAVNANVVVVIRGHSGDLCASLRDGRLRRTDRGLRNPCFSICRRALLKSSFKNLFGLYLPKTFPPKLQQGKTDMLFPLQFVKLFKTPSWSVTSCSEKTSTGSSPVPASSSLIDEAERLPWPRCDL